MHQWAMMQEAVMVFMIRWMVFLVTFFLVVPFTARDAEARCYTNQIECSGTATFFNMSSYARCATVFRADGNTKSFCLRSGEAEVDDARTGDQVCWSDGNRNPPLNCKRQWILVE